jgi:integrase
MPSRRETPIPRINPSGTKVWIARYTGRDGKRRSAGTFKLKRDAQDAIDAAYRAPVRRDTVGAYFGDREQNGRNEEGSDWTDRYPRSDRTDKTNRGRIRAVLAVEIDGRLLRDWPFAEIRRKHILELVDRMLRDQGRATTGASNVLRALSTMAEDAITDEIIGANPFKGVRVRRSDPRATKARRQPTILSWEEMHAFAAAASRRRRDRLVRAPELEPMLRMLGDCGLRIGELFALRRELQDLRAGVFRVKGSGWEGVLVEDSETKNHDRVGPIPPTTLALLRAMPTRIDTPWQFPTPRGAMWRINNFYRDVWRPTREASGMNCTPHDFRHSWVSLLAAAGIDESDLADVAGHGLEVQGRYRHSLGRSFERIRSVIG